MRSFVLAIVLLMSPLVGAWSDHATLAWPYLRTVPALNQPTLEAQPLAAFLAAEAEDVVRVLDGVEEHMLASNPIYPPTPDGLRFKDVAADSAVADFLAAIRVNPRLGYSLYQQVMPGDPAAPGLSLAWADLSFLPPGESHQDTVYAAIVPGEKVSIASVLATASDEPDFGMDVGLYINNGSEHGMVYGLGEQPFGNPNLPYGSQAPLHMGFYHLDWLTRTAQPDLLRTLPLWRITLYRDLARLAFETGHSYWGWRFMGWALHYIGDLSQPYHAEPLPGVSTGSALWSVLWGETGALVQQVSNRHGVLESYQYQRVSTLIDAGQWQAPLLQAIATAQPGCFKPEGVVPQLTAQAVARGTELDQVLSDTAPPRFVSDPGFEWVGSGLEAEVVDQIARQGGDRAIDQLDAVIANSLRAFSAHLQGWIAHGAALQARSKSGCVP